MPCQQKIWLISHLLLLATVACARAYCVTVHVILNHRANTALFHPLHPCWLEGYFYFCFPFPMLQCCREYYCSGLITLVAFQWRPDWSDDLKSKTFATRCNQANWANHKMEIDKTETLWLCSRHIQLVLQLDAFLLQCLYIFRNSFALYCRRVFLFQNFAHQFSSLSTRLCHPLSLILCVFFRRCCACSGIVPPFSALLRASAFHLC